MKRLYLFVSIFFIFVFSVNAYAKVNVDGRDDGIEWQGAECFLLINEPRINNVDYAYALTQVSSEYEVDFLLFLSDRISESYNNSGFILTVNDNLEVRVSSAGVEVDGDSAEYYVDSAMAVVTEDGASCEIKVGFRKGLPKEISAKVCFVDGNGNYSYYHPLSVINPYFEKETEATQTSTTKQYITEKQTEKKTEESKTTKKNSPTEKENAKPKTTKKSADKTVVYFYEKEVIVSQVYNPVDEYNMNAYNAATEIYSASSSADIVSLSEGLKVQKIICIAGGVLLLCAGAWASLSGKIKKTKTKPDEENKDKDKED